jgi:hypothetical protein
LLVSGSTDCHTIDDPTYAGQLLNYVQNGSGLRSENCVRFYYELDYDIFESSEQDVQQATNWITAVHNNVATLYDNDQITTALSGIYIWTTEDPYHGSTATSQLN